MSGPSGLPLCLVLLVATATGHVAATPLGNTTIPQGTAGGFQSGVLYVTPQGRLTMPPGAVLIVTPTLSFPMDRDYPLGYGSSATVSMPFTIDLDTLGLTSDANSWGVQNRVTRQAPTEGNLAGGDREVVYRVVQNSFQSAGLDGRACLLRTICELNLNYAPDNCGLLGEAMQLILSPTKSPRPLGEYMDAEVQAKTVNDCSKYYERCPYSFFLDQKLATDSAAKPATDSAAKPANATIPKGTAGGFQAGVLYVTPQGRLTMPPGAVLIVTPTLSLPVGSDYPLGYGSSATVSVPFKFDLDTLGLTSDANSWGLLNRVTRQAPTEGNLAGGDREVVYRVVENSIQSAGLDGRACLLRTICEINLDAAPDNFGLLGEAMQLILSPTRSPRPLGEYTDAEVQARTVNDCSKYYERCPYSFFQDQKPATDSAAKPATASAAKPATASATEPAAAP